MAVLFLFIVVSCWFGVCGLLAWVVYSLLFVGLRLLLRFVVLFVLQFCFIWLYSLFVYFGSLDLCDCCVRVLELFGCAYVQGVGLIDYCLLCLVSYVLLWLLGWVAFDFVAYLFGYCIFVISLLCFTYWYL